MTTGLSNPCAYLIAICVSVVLTAVFIFTTMWCKKCGVVYVEYDATARADMPVDAVYTWVDPQDAAWKQAYAANVPTATLSKKRFNNNRAPAAELQTSVELLLQNCPWVRTIYIATMRPQVPPFLRGPAFTQLVESGRIRVVHHDEFFEDVSVLPVFNSRPIEGNLHRIPGLSKQWLYLNDDMMTGRPVEKNMLFHDGKPVLRGTFLPVYTGVRLEEHVSGWTNNGKLLNYMWYFHNDHNAAANDRDVVAAAATLPLVAPAWVYTLRSKLRGHDQIIPLGLVDNVALDSGLYVVHKKSPIKTLCRLSKHMGWSADMSMLKRYHFFCINNLPPDTMLEKMNSIRTSFQLPPIVATE